MVAVGYKDGVVRVFECEGLDESVRVSLHSMIQSPVGGECRCSCIGSNVWRTSDAGDGGSERVVLVGYGIGASSSSKALLRAYRYDGARFRWEDVDGLADMSPGDRAGGIAAVSWAPLAGREAELVAVAMGAQVVLYSLHGPLDRVTVHEVAVLEHKDAVWQVKWNMTGNWLAVSTDGNEICMWRPDLAGDWRLLHTVVGK